MRGLRLDGLIGLSSAIQFESPSSWFTRAALGQGVTVQELASHVGWFAAQDLDLMFAVMYEAGLPKDIPALAGLEVARRVLVGYQRSGCRADRMLLMGRKRRGSESGGLLATARRRARYRFCPACLKTDWVPYVRQEWRFNCWRYCPEHLCMLEEHCPHCAATLELPASLVRGGHKKNGVADLSYCVRCGGSLTAVGLRNLPSPCERENSLEIVQLANGRAALAAMYHGRVRIKGEEGERPLQHLHMLENLGLLPTRNHATPTERGLSAGEMRD